MFPNTTSTTGTTSTAQVYLNWTRAAHEHWRSQTFTKGGRPPVSRAPRPCQFALPPTQAPHPGCPGSPGHRWGRLPPPEPECVRLRDCPVEAEGEGARAHLPNLGIRFVPFNDGHIAFRELGQHCMTSTILDSPGPLVLPWTHHPSHLNTNLQENVYHIFCHFAKFPRRFDLVSGSPRNLEGMLGCSVLYE